MQRALFLSCVVLVSFLSIAYHRAFAEQKQLNVYSARKEALIKPLLDRFGQQYDVKVRLVTAKGDALLTRLVSEGKNSPADVLITTDVGRLHRAKEANVLQAFSSPLLQSRIPEQYRDPENTWYGLSLRSRVIVYAPERVNPEQLNRYESLSDTAWQKRICIRSSSNIYNQSLVASMIAHKGLEKTEHWLKGFVANFARPPKGGDRDQIKALASGQCDVAVVNSYYLGAMLDSSDAKERAQAEAVKLFWPNQADRGAHMNISGIGITQHAPNKAAAIKLAEFLSSDASQAWYAQVNHEYPVRANITISDTLKKWGPYKADSLPVEKLAVYNASALKAMDRANWK